MSLISNSTDFQSFLVAAQRRMDSLDAPKGPWSIDHDEGSNQHVLIEEGRRYPLVKLFTECHPILRGRCRREP